MNRSVVVNTVVGLMGLIVMMAFNKYSANGVVGT
jgi:hypothetical protein